MPSVCSKYSFDRFGDDLCEAIVGYLLMADKFRFECLSRQWKRCVYQKQNELIIDYKLVNTLKRTDLLGQKYIDLDLMETVVKKCRFVTHIFVETIREQSRENYRQLVSLIAKYCECLVSIDMYFDENDDKLFELIFTQFGPKLRRIGFNNNSALNERHLILCPNLRDVNIKRLNNSNLKSLFFQPNDISLKKLSKFQFKYSLQEVKGFQHFVNKCKNSLKTIDIQVINSDEYSVDLLLNGIREFKGLKVLRLDFSSMPLRYSIAELIEQIGHNCSQLQCFQLRINSYDLFICVDIFNRIKHFSRLKRFEFKFFTAAKASKECQQLRSEMLRDCHQLSNLSIEGTKIYDIFFQNIGRNLPKLQYLNVSNAKISEKALKELCRLPDLRSLDLYSQQKLSMEAIEELIKGCDKIRSIEFSSYGTHLALNDLTIQRIKSKSMSFIEATKKSVLQDLKRNRRQQ